MTMALIKYRSLIDPELTWDSAADLEAWKALHPDDLRGQIVVVQTEEAAKET